MSFVIVSAVTAMHKEMHEKAAEQKHEREIRRNMLPVVDHEIQPHDYEKTDKCPPNRLIFHIIFSSALAYKL